jgi:pyruvate, water dikinase
MGERYTIPFTEVGLEQVELVGGKNAHLGDLLQAGFPVPPGFAVTTAAHERDDIGPALATAYAHLGRAVGHDSPPVAVRSSAVAEDMPDASFAGVQDTYLWLCGLDEVLDGVRRCWASFHNPEAVAYREAHGIARGGMSVAVQYMVDARVAGVMFTLNPVTGDPSSIAVDASYGLGATIVGGEVTPDSFLISKVTGEVVRSELGEKAVECVPGPPGEGTITRPVDDERRARLCLEPEEIGRLVDLARRVERHYGRHQDLEWAIDRRLGEIFLLQSRPETVWSQKAKARPALADGPIAAIAATFLGGSSPKQ